MSGIIKSMSKEKIVTALDIGSSTARVGCALLRPGSLPRLIGVGQAPSAGVRRGQIVDGEEVVASLNEAFGEAERTAGVAISKATVAVGGPQIELRRSRGAVAISRADGEVSQDEIERVLESSRAVSLPSNREIIAASPVSFSVDDDAGLESPLGLRGVRLEVDTMLVIAPQPFLRAITKSLKAVGREVEGWLWESFASSRAILTKKQKEAGVVLANIGGAMTNLSYFEERQLRNACTIPLGASSVTHDIAIGLRMAIDVAERIKIDYGSSLTSAVSKREQVVLADWGIENLNVSRYALSQIIESRMFSVIGLIEKELRGFTKAKHIPAGVVLTGGGAKLAGLAELAKRELKLPVSVGRARDIESGLAEAFDPAFSTVAGTILWVADGESRSRAETSKLWGELENPGGLWRKIGGWLQELLP